MFDAIVSFFRILFGRDEAARLADKLMKYAISLFVQAVLRGDVERDLVSAMETTAETGEFPGAAVDLSPERQMFVASLVATCCRDQGIEDLKRIFAVTVYVFRRGFGMEAETANDSADSLLRVYVVLAVSELGQEELAAAVDIDPSLRAGHKAGVAAAHRLLARFDEKEPIAEDEDADAFLALGAPTPPAEEATPG